jgi:hypothetical protein
LLIFPNIITEQWGLWPLKFWFKIYIFGWKLNN